MKKFSPKGGTGMFNQPWNFKWKRIEQTVGKGVFRSLIYNIAQVVWFDPDFGTRIQILHLER